MDNFKKFDKPKRAKASVDGFWSNGATDNLRPGITPSPQLGMPKAGPAPVTDGFRRLDGFHPSQATPLVTQSPSITAQGGDVFGQYRNLPPVADDSSITKKKHKRRRGGAFRKVFKRVFLSILVLIIASGLYFGVKLYFTSKSVFKGGVGAPALAKAVDINKLNGEGDGRINIMLIGKGGDNHPGGELTDTMLLLSIDPIQKEAAIVSIPRDLWVKPAGHSGYSKLNAAYNFGKEESKTKDKDQQEAAGIKELYDTLTPVIGIPIHYYVMVDFTAYKNVVDTVGGVDINLEHPIYDPNFDWQYGKDALKLSGGNIHLSGTQALLLGRARGAHGGYGLATDFDRNANQRKMLISLKEKILSVGTFSNPVKVNQLITQLGSHVHTSFSSLDETKRLYQIMQTIPSDKITSLDFVTAPHNYLTTGSVGGQSVVIPKAGIGQYAALQTFVRNTLKDSFLKQESAVIGVYNATSTPGLASTKAEELRSYGYTVSTVSNAQSTGNSQTTVVDLSGGVKKYTKRYLEQRFKTTAVNTMPDTHIVPGNVDFVIILGQDQAL